MANYALLLAAGLSRRMGGESKLIRKFGEAPIVRRAAENLLSGGVDGLFVVTGRGASKIRAALEALPITFVENPNPEAGQASSIVAGVRALPPDAETVLIALGDMPKVSPRTVRLLLTAHGVSKKGLTLPLICGERGHPALLTLPKYREQLLALTGDVGARSIFIEHEDDLLEVEAEDPGILLDIDTEDELNELNRRLDLE
ncbi:MAG: hypothetical protein C0609_06040 [Deltaproteobacteria bacterium]|nr:MAG: hypothetical protein C0609_06040 [Deltaproteobacteria bacterium]